MLKRIGTDARLRIEELVGQKVNLKLWVRIDPAWRQSARGLEELGYMRPSAASHVASAGVTEAEAEAIASTDAMPDDTEDAESEGEQ